MGGGSSSAERTGRSEARHATRDRYDERKRQGRKESRPEARTPRERERENSSCAERTNTGNGRGIEK